jgi:hypothetical protein
MRYFKISCECYSNLLRPPPGIIVDTHTKIIYGIPGRCEIKEADVYYSPTLAVERGTIKIKTMTRKDQFSERFYEWIILVKNWIPQVYVDEFEIYDISKGIKT